MATKKNNIHVPTPECFRKIKYLPQSVLGRSSTYFRVFQEDQEPTPECFGKI
ncbi:hypothetical protein ACJMK2_042823, partial [Sinanodonta woodiana]